MIAFPQQPRDCHDTHETHVREVTLSWLERNCISAEGHAYWYSMGKDSRDNSSLGSLSGTGMNTSQNKVSVVDGFLIQQVKFMACVALGRG